MDTARNAYSDQLQITCLQDELQFDGARVLDIDASSHVLLISGKSPGWRGGHALAKVFPFFTLST